MLKFRKGTTLIDIVLAVALFAILAGSLITVLAYIQENSWQFSLRNRAILLAEEGIAATTNIYHNDFINLTTGTNYLTINNNQWQLTSSPETIDSFSRTIEITDLSATQKQVVSKVAWQDNNQNQEVSLLKIFTEPSITAPSGDWGNPVSAGSLNFQGGQSGWRVKTAGDYAYFIRENGSPNFIVVDITNPDNPTVASSLTLDGSLFDIFMNNDYLFITSDDKDKELQVIDITNPTSPYLYSSFDAVGNDGALGVYIQGDYAYLTRDVKKEDDFLIVDISDLNSMQAVGSLSLTGIAYDLWFSNDYIYIVSSDNDEIQVIDVSDASNPFLETTVDLSGSSNAVTISGSGSKLYIGRSSGLIHFIDISTANNPVEVGSYDASSGVNDLLVNGTELFIASNYTSGEFQLVDVSDVNSPSLIGMLDWSANINGLAYNTDHDLVIGAVDDGQEELIIITPQ